MKAHFRNKVAPFLIIPALVVLIYSNTLTVPFTFDDESSIEINQDIRDLGRFAGPGILGESRVVGTFTFALNYMLNGLDVSGYHIFNILVHIVNSLLVYLLVLGFFYTPLLSNIRESGVRFALAAALLFSCHPVQTQAVTYIVQRYASLAAMFSLFGVLLYSKARLSEKLSPKRVYYLGALLSTVLAMGTKENAFVLPLLLTLYEFTFLNEKPAKRLLFLFPFLMTMSLIPISRLISSGDAIAGAIRADTDMPVRDYLFTQFRVIMTYMRLMFLPVNQNLDYDFPVYDSFFRGEVILSFLFLTSLLVCGLHLFFRGRRKGDQLLRLTGFGIFWFFIALSVESSVLPIADVIFEHRLYLPSVGFLIAVLAFTFRAAAGLSLRKIRILTPALLVAIFFLSVTAYSRNDSWSDETVLMHDTIKKSPRKARPYFNLGVLYFERKRFGDALKYFVFASKLDPLDADSFTRLGDSCFRLKDFPYAIKNYKNSLQIEPGNAEVHFSLGRTYAAVGLEKNAMIEFRTALRLDPGLQNLHIEIEEIER